MKNSLTLWFLIGFIFMALFGLWAVFDKSDWIFLFLFIGIVVLNVKLNKIIRLLSKK